MTSTNWERLDNTRNGPAFKDWLKDRLITEEEFNKYEFAKVNDLRTAFDDQQQGGQQRRAQANAVDFHCETLLTLSDVPASEMNETAVITGWRREAGTTRLVRIFLRTHLVAEKKPEIDRFMDEAQTGKTRMYVSGPPGSGKTTFFLAYFTQWARKHKKRGLIVQYRQRSGGDIIILQGADNPAYVKSRRLAGHMLTSLVSDVESAVSPDFCVFDGVRLQDPVCANLLSSINTIFENRKVVHITSLEFDIKGGDGTQGIHGVDVDMTVSSWEYEDYKASYSSGIYLENDWLHLLTCKDDFADEEEEAAAGGDEMEDAGVRGDDNDNNDQDQGIEQDDTPRNENDRESAGSNEMAVVVKEDQPQNENDQDRTAWILSLLERKFFYAGGSARFMFDFTMEDLLKKDVGVLDKLEQRTSQEEWTSFATLTISSRTVGSVSSLLQRIGSRVFPVSKYFLLIGYEKCNGQLVKALKAAAEAVENPAMKGWAFEMEQLDNITDQMVTSRSVSNVDGSLVLPVAENAVVYDGCHLTGDTSRTRFVIKCSKWNQGCFDSAFVIDDRLVTINFTISASHSLKVRYIGLLKMALESANKDITSVTHLAIVADEATCSSFRFDGPEDAGYENGVPLFELKLARSTKFEKPRSVPELVSSGSTPADENTAVVPKLGFGLGSVEIFPDRQGVRKRRRPEILDPSWRNKTEQS